MWIYEKFLLIASFLVDFGRIFQKVPIEEKQKKITLVHTNRGHATPTSKSTANFEILIVLIFLKDFRKNTTPIFVAKKRQQLNLDLVENRDPASYSSRNLISFPLLPIMSI